MHFIKKYGTQIIIHLLFWALFIFVSLFVLTQYYWAENPFLQYLFILVVIVYTNNMVLLPYFVQKRWYFIYTAVFLTIAFLATQLYCNVFTRCGCSFLKCLSDYLWQTIVPLTFFSFIWMLFRYIERTQEIEAIKQERTTLELKFLKSQINPHVLLNNLNTIYSFSLEKPDETPNLILKLAENLKHVLYESNSEKVPLSNELLFIDNYIEFQKLRTEGIKTINYTTSIDNTIHRIAPLLLITLIENAFKHSLLGSTIDIKINVNDNYLNCICSNDYDPNKQASETSIGLENLKKRLDLLYRDNYELKIETNGIFKVTLRLNLL
ncbi:conserved membrane hypothetical protein [Tenacibaculum xiamenense]